MVPDSLECLMQTRCADKKSDKCRKFKLEAHNLLKRVTKHLKSEHKLRKLENKLTNQIWKYKTDCSKVDHPKKALACAKKVHKLRKTRKQVRRRLMTLRRSRNKNEQLRRGIQI